MDATQDADVPFKSVPTHLIEEGVAELIGNLNEKKHSLSQQDDWASFGHPNPQKSPFRTPKFFCEQFLKISISSLFLIFLY